MEQEKKETEIYQLFLVINVETRKKFQEEFLYVLIANMDYAEIVGKESQKNRKKFIRNHILQDQFLISNSLALIKIKMSLMHIIKNNLGNLKDITNLLQAQRWTNMASEVFPHCLSWQKME